MTLYAYAYDAIRIRVLLAYGTRMRCSLISELHCTWMLTSLSKALAGTLVCLNKLQRLVTKTVSAIANLTTFLSVVVIKNQEQAAGAPNDSFLSNPLKRYFRLPGVPLKLYRFILGSAIIFLSVRSF